MKITQMLKSNAESKQYSKLMVKKQYLKMEVWIMKKKVTFALKNVQHIPSG